MWLFDQTDMAEAKRILGGRACIAGNVPSSLLAVGTAGEMEQYVTDLLDTCAKDGGFMLDERRGGRRRQAGDAQGHDRHGTRLERMTVGVAGDTVAAGSASERERAGKCRLFGPFLLVSIDKPQAGELDFHRVSAEQHSACRTPWQSLTTTRSKEPP